MEPRDADDEYLLDEEGDEEPDEAEAAAQQSSELYALDLVARELPA